MKTPEQWAQEAIENAVSRVGLRPAIADVIRKALHEQRIEFANEVLTDKGRPA